MQQSKEERLINIPSDPAKAKASAAFAFARQTKLFLSCCNSKKLFKVRLGGKLLERKKAKVKITEINNPNYYFGV